MTEQTYLVLLALAQQPRHGYGVAQAVKELSDGVVRLGAGTLYGILDRIVAEEYAEASGEQIVDGRLRRYYRLTDAGGDALTAETVRLQAIARRAQVVLRARPAGGPGFAGLGSRAAALGSL
ncbi:MAG: PadR family transcriptional regulator [Cellulomonas sp.]